jgi:predicted GNAT family N-acyltransferase
MDNILISQVAVADPRYQEVWELREAVLRKPIGLSLRNEDLSKDKEDVILAAVADSGVIGCLMITTIDSKKLKLRQMAVYDGWQGKGIGKMLMQAAEQYAAGSGYDKIVLHARKVAMGFYEALGYMVTSDEFEEVGVPHFVMEKSL